MSADIVQARYTELEGVAGRFAGVGERVQEVARGVQGRADVLRRGGWEGRGQAAFLAELDALVLPSLGRLAAALAEARDVTQQMRQAIQLAEDEAARLFQVNGAGNVPNNGNEVAPSADADGVDDTLALLSSAGLLVGPALVKFLEFVSEHSTDRKATLAAFREMGRLLNRYLGTTGNVGAMEKLYRKLVVQGLPYRGNVAKLLGSKGFLGFLVFAGATFDAMEDWQNGKYGDDWLKTGGVNLLGGSLDFALGLTPPGRVVLLANTANQLLGTAEVYAMQRYTDLAANDTMRQLMQNDVDRMKLAYDKMDVTNITKELAEGIWDGYGELLTPHRNMVQAYWSAFNEVQRNPSWATLDRVAGNLAETSWNNMPGLLTSSVHLLAPGTGWMYTNAGKQNLGDALRATGDVVDGLIDSNLIRFSSSLNRGVNSTIGYVDHLPVSDALKRQIGDAATETAKHIQAGSTWTTNLITF